MLRGSKKIFTQLFLDSKESIMYGQKTIVMCDTIELYERSWDLLANLKNGLDILKKTCW